MGENTHSSEPDPHPFRDYFTKILENTEYNRLYIKILEDKLQKYEGKDQSTEDLSVENTPERNKSLWSRLIKYFKKDKPTQGTTTVGSLERLNLYNFLKLQNRL